MQRKTATTAVSLLLCIYLFHFAFQFKAGLLKGQQLQQSSSAIISPESGYYKTIHIFNRFSGMSSGKGTWLKTVLKDIVDGKCPESR